MDRHGQEQHLSPEVEVTLGASDAQILSWGFMCETQCEHRFARRDDTESNSCHLFKLPSVPK